MNHFDSIVTGFIGHALAGARWADQALAAWTSLALFHEPTELERGRGEQIAVLNGPDQT